MWASWLLQYRMITWRPAVNCPPAAEYVGDVDAAADAVASLTRTRTASPTTTRTASPGDILTLIRQTHPLRMPVNVGRSRGRDGPVRRPRLAPDLIRRQNCLLMPNAVIVDAVRTPVGRRGGRLSGWHATDLAAQPLAALLARNDLDPRLVEDVVMGCTMTVGEQAMNIARNAALAAGFPESVPGTTVDRQCGSAQQAIHFAAQAVMAGAMDVAIGAGVESMSRVPIGSTTEPGPGEAYGPLYKERFELIHQGECAEEIARRWKITRDDMDQLALRSHQRAALAQDEGRFTNEIAPLEARVHPDVPGAAEVRGLFTADEGVRRDTSLEKLANLKPAFSETGTVTAGTSSQISDGAAAVLIMSEERASSLGLTPRARFHTFAVAANDPQIMLTAVIPATELVLSKAKMTLDDIDLVEINEAFASVVLAWSASTVPTWTR